MNIIDLVKEIATQKLVSKLSSQLGENESSISKAIKSYIPVIIGSLIDKKSSNCDIFENIKKLDYTADISQLSSSNNIPQELQNIKESLIGINSDSLISKVAKFSGISYSSSSKLFNLSTFLTFKNIYKYISDKSLDERSFFNILDTTKNKLNTLIPTGFNIKTLGIKTFENIDRYYNNIEDNFKYNINNSKKETIEYCDNKSCKKKFGWLLPLIIFLIAGLFLLRKCNNNKVIDNSNENEKKYMTESDNIDNISDSNINNSNAIQNDKNYQEIELDNNTKLKGIKGGLEEKIINFINSAEYKNMDNKELENKWFDLDNVAFVFGRTNKFIGDSDLQISNIVSILNKFPNLKIKIGAYTDKVGGEKINLNLSNKRAQYIKSQIISKGISEDRIKAEGFGQKFAKVDINASNEERASDRKISISIIK